MRLLSKVCLWQAARALALVAPARRRRDLRAAPLHAGPGRPAAPEFVDDAVAWAQTTYPAAHLDVADAGEGIVTSAIFWGLGAAR